MVARFVDTSYLLALSDASDSAHGAVLRDFGSREDEDLTTHGYVVAETLSLARRRLGPDITRRLIDELLPALVVIAVDDGLHRETVRAFRDEVATGVSFVDRTSFAFMRSQGIDTALALDRDFRTAGFRVLP